MKRWSAYLCLFLALLLPIRGALAAAMPISHSFGHGDMVVMQMSQSTAPTEVQALHPHHCPHHSAHHDVSCGSHQQHLLCDLCNGPALSLAIPSTILAPVHPGTQMPRLVSFISVSLPSEVKPPIL